METDITREGEREGEREEVKERDRERWIDKHYVEKERERESEKIDLEDKWVVEGVKVKASTILNLSMQR